jgi:hypothetical protein
MEYVFFRSTDVRKYFLPVLLFLGACCSPGERRVDIVLRNASDRPIELRASAGIFSRQLQLMPGEVWRGWIPLEFAAGEIRVEVADDSRFRPAR